MNIAELIVGVAGVVGGVKAIKNGLGDSEPETAKTAGKIMAHMPYSAKLYDVKTIEQRVKRCIELAHKGKLNPNVRAFAVKAISMRCGKDWCIGEKDYLGEINAVYNAVRNSVRYVRDIQGVDLFQHPMRTLQFGGGDCDDFSIVVASTLGSIGYPVLFRVIRTKDSPDWNHIYNMVGVPPRAPSRWVPVDASVGRGAGWQAPRSMIAAVKDFPAR